MGEALERRERPPVKDWMSIIVFDGRGGVRKLTDEEESQPYTVPQKGFVLLSGNSRSPDFKVWLREELGDFISDMISVPSTRTRSSACRPGFPRTRHVLTTSTCSSSRAAPPAPPRR